MMELTARLSGINMTQGGVRLDTANQKTIPTAREVRASAQSIIRNLVMMTTTLQELPRRRFITLKIIYNDSAPADYQPPHFRSADAATHRFTFGTKTLQEAPDESAFGTLETGHHTVAVHVASVADNLPLPLPLDPESMRHSISARSDVLKQEAAQQKQDADERRVVWDAEETAHDGLSDIEEMDENPGSTSDADAPGGSDLHARAAQQLKRAREERVGLRRGIQLGVPVGLRLSDGKIAPVPMSAVDEVSRRMDARSAGKHGIGGDEHDDQEDVRDIEVFISKMIRKEWNVDTNEDLLRNVVSPRRHGSLQSTVAPMQSSPATGMQTIANVPGPVAAATIEQTAPSKEAPPVANHPRQDADGDENMHRPEEAPRSPPPGPTGAAAKSQQRPLEDKAAALPQSGKIQEKRSPQPDKGGTKSRSTAAEPPSDDSNDVTECACGDQESDGLMIQCSVCKVWVHAACYGIYLGTQVQDSFKCYKDRFQDTFDESSKVYDALRKLALTRRALHLVYDTNRAWPESLAKLAARIGTTPRIATQIRNELKAEGYLRNASPDQDPHLFTSLRSSSHQSQSHQGPSQHSQSHKKGASKSRSRKAVNAQVVIVQSASIKRQMRQKYFAPGLGKESEVVSAALQSTAASAQQGVSSNCASLRRASLRASANRRVLSFEASTVSNAKAGQSTLRKLVLVPETVPMPEQPVSMAQAAGKKGNPAQAPNGKRNGEKHATKDANRRQCTQVDQGAAMDVDRTVEQSLTSSQERRAETQVQPQAIQRTQNACDGERHEVRLVFSDRYSSSAPDRSLLLDPRQPISQHAHAGHASKEAGNAPPRSEETHDEAQQRTRTPTRGGDGAGALGPSTRANGSGNSNNSINHKRAAAPDFQWPGSRKKISLTEAIEIEEEGSIVS